MTLVHPVKGLHAAPGVAGPKFCSEALNVFDNNNRIVKRGGQLPVTSIVGSRTTGVYQGLGQGTTVPNSVGTGAQAAGAIDNTPYYGHSAPFNRLIASATMICVRGVGTRRSNLVAEYSTGPTTWATLEYTFLSQPYFYPAKNASVGPPLIARSPQAHNGETLPTDTSAVDMIFVPPTNWVAATIGGQSKYWIRIRGYVAGDFYPGSSGFQLESASVQTTENRILGGLAFRGRNNVRHLFLAYLYGTAGTDLRFSLNGTVLTQSDGLSPDGSAVLFNGDTKVRAVYHDPTDRIIGHVQGLGWFYQIPTANTEIYPFIPDDGEGTRYGNESEGNRSAFPDSDVFAIHEGRMFMAVGSRIYWSAPDEFVAIMPNANFADISDEDGEIVAMESIAGVLVIFKRDSTWSLQPDGSAEGYQKQRINGGLGCVAPRSVVKHGSDIFRLTESGPAVLHNGTSEELIQENISELFNGKWSSDPSKAVGVFSSALSNQYRLFYPSIRSHGVLDAALYGVIAQNSRGDGEVRWWPQGKPTRRMLGGTPNQEPYGFNATCVISDISSDPNSILLGDKYGVLWRMDAGYKDGGSPVRSLFRSAPLGAGGGQQRTLRWINVAFKNTGRRNWTLTARYEGKPELEKSFTLNAVRGTDNGIASGIADDDTIVLEGTECVGVNDTQMRQVQFGTRCRQFQLAAQSDIAAPMQWNGFEVEVNAMGRRTETVATA